MFHLSCRSSSLRPRVASGLLGASLLLVQSAIAQTVTPPRGGAGSSRALEGFVDMHAHPMTNLAFGGKLIHGAPDVGALISTDASCRTRVRARSMAHALEIDNATHGGWGFNNTCGDMIRQQVIDQLQKENRAFPTPDGAPGAPTFAIWPRWDDITHQKMYIDWIRRAHRGGLAVMVALATHNETVAAAVSGPGDGPGDDRASADLQIQEIKAMVGRHSTFMEIARTSDDLRRIVAGGKLAVVLGVEIDNIGNFHRFPRGGVTPSMVRAELNRLHALGVRYIFPTHVVDNVFAGTAVYTGAFNLSNRHLTGAFWNLQCSSAATDSITKRYQPEGFDVAFAFVKVVKLGLSPADNPPPPPPCPANHGHVNGRGLTALGDSALRAMMKLGMLIDIDHMSQRAANRALAIAEAVPGGGYPLNSGHNGARSTLPRSDRHENSRTHAQMERIAALGGVLGVGMADITAPQYVANYRVVAAAMRNKGVALGTDFNGLVKGVRPGGAHVTYDEDFPQSRLGSRTWHYGVDGVAHYGMLPDFIRALEGLEGGQQVVSTLMQSAEHFARMWEAAERQSRQVR